MVPMHLYAASTTKTPNPSHSTQWLQTNLLAAVLFTASVVLLPLASLAESAHASVGGGVSKCSKHEIHHVQGHFGGFRVGDNVRIGRQSPGHPMRADLLHTGLQRGEHLAA